MLKLAYFKFLGDTCSNVGLMPLSYTSNSYASFSLGPCSFSLGPCSIAVNQGLTIYFKMSTCIPKVRQCDYLNKGTFERHKLINLIN